MKEQSKKEQVDYWIKTAWLSISRMYNAFAADYETTYASGLALLYIDVEKGTPATKIAPQMGMESRSLTRILKTLEERGMIIREADATDKRKVIVRLTPAGIQYRDYSKRTVLGFNEFLRSEIAPEKLSCFFEVMQQIQASTEAYASQAIREKAQTQENFN
ncbi:MAG: MarR family winged helix-turn-helix transcriptional regulator [Bernardetiaceae bacterium]